MNAILKTFSLHWNAITMATIEDWVEENNHIQISCPECGGINYDAPTTCVTCWGEGGLGYISLKQFVYEIILNKT